MLTAYNNGIKEWSLRQPIKMQNATTTATTYEAKKGHQTTQSFSTD